MCVNVGSGASVWGLVADSRSTGNGGKALGAALHTSEGPGAQPRKVTLPAAQHISSHTTLLQVPSLLHEMSRALKPLSSQ